jgi:cellulose biosynthesis protein BcsQ
MNLGSEQKRGIIYTFYSYKGGVGRSMALANVAALLARWGQRVLIVDWDLEAPGIEKFFSRWLTGSRTATPGLVELMQSVDSGTSRDWRSGLLHARLPQSKPIDIIPAGQDDSQYAARLRAVDWDRLFAERNLGMHLERIRREWQAEYDFTLIDSRTGITDIGGICTIHLPDVLVCLFTTTEQSLDGVKDVMERAQRAHASLPVDRKRLLVIPVPARDESRTEYKLAEEWRAKFAEKLAPFYQDWIPRDVSAAAALDLIKIPYVAFWSFGERLPVLEEDADNPDKLSFFFQLLARLMLGNLDLREVRQGDRATHAEQEQKAAAERLAREAALARERALKEAAEHAASAAAAAHAERSRRMAAYLEERFEPAMRRSRRLAASRVLALPAGVAILLAFVSLDTAGMSADFGIPTSWLTVLAYLIVPALTGLLWFLGSKHARIAGTLDRERALFDARAGQYGSASSDSAVAQFVERSEHIITGEVPLPGHATAELASDPVVPSPARPAPYDATRLVQSVLAAPQPQAGAPASYDFLVSAHEDPFTEAWLTEFLPLFASWTSDYLGRRVTIFNSALAGAQALAPAQAQAADLSRDQVRLRAECLLAIVTARYFSEPVTEGDWASFASGGRPILPILLRGTHDALPPHARQIAFEDFREFALIGEGFQKSERYVDFQVRIQRLAEAAAKRLTERQHRGEHDQLVT